MERKQPAGASLARWRQRRSALPITNRDALDSVGRSVERTAAENNSREEEREGIPLVEHCGVMHIHEEFAERLLSRTSATLSAVRSTLAKYLDKFVTEGIFKVRICKSLNFQLHKFHLEFRAQSLDQKKKEYENYSGGNREEHRFVQIINYITEVFEVSATPRSRFGIQDVFSGYLR